MPHATDPAAPAVPAPRATRFPYSTVNVNLDTHRRLRAAAGINGCTIKALAETALSHYLDRLEDYQTQTRTA